MAKRSSATKLAPENAAVWQARAKVLTTLKRPTEAAAAAKKGGRAVEAGALSGFLALG